MNPFRRFEGQVAFVTGASRGIGRVIARAFASEGAAVGLFGLRKEALQEVESELTAAGRRAVALEGDVTNEVSVREAFDEAERNLGPVRILVNNAGISGPTAPVTHITLSDWERVLTVNLTGPFLCAREALRHMTERCRREPGTGGSILNISSVAGKISYPRRTPYASSKWGLIGLTLTLAEEAGPFGIRVNCLCPGPVAGQHLEEVIRARARDSGLPPEKVREKFLGLTMLKRLVHPEDVAKAALFLASEDAANITGQALDVTGGLAQFPG